MGVAFEKIIKSLLPKGKIWETQQNLNSLIQGTAREPKRIYDKATNFYNEFNIINSFKYAPEHSQDYLIIQNLYTSPELQRIIVEYLNKDYEFREAIEDFADFIGVDLVWKKMPLPLEFGVWQFGDEFGDPNASETCELLLEFDITVTGNITCQQYNKILWLVNYLKPPYLKITFENPPSQSTIDFEFGYSQFGDSFGDYTPCELIL